MDEQNGTLCPDGRLNAVVAQLRTDDEGGLAGIATLLQTWPLDPRLHFLKGSVLAGLQRYEEGRGAMARAIEIAPDFALARFQLGFLDLTSGRAVEAMGVWQKLGDLPEDDALRIFAEGLANLAIDNFAEAVRLLRRGMGLNTQNPLLNADMQLILDEIEPKLAAQQLAGAATDPAAAADPAPAAQSDAAEDAPASAVDLLLRQQGARDPAKPTKH